MKKKIGLFTACSIVIANMIGTGVFTSLGFQLASLQNSWTIFILWTAGGALSLFGAFAYAELGTHYKESGGDYIYLSRVFHPLLGYLSAWMGLTIGFTAPVALSAMALAKYLSPFGLGGNIWLPIGVIVLSGLLHTLTIKHSSRFQNITTLIKIVFIVLLVALGFLLFSGKPNAIDFSSGWQRELFTPAFAVSMIYVSYAYTGWNAAAYVAEEIRDPHKNLPKALIGSTLFVAAVYVAFQFALLNNATVAEMQNKEDVSFVAFDNLLGSTGGKWVSAFVAVQLIATISSYLWVGPRVTYAMATEYKLWRPLATRNEHGIPVRAVWLHVLVCIALALTGSFEKVLLYAGFALQLMTSLTVATSLFLKKKDDPNIFKSPWKPWLQVIFLLFNAATLIFTAYDRPFESLAGIGIIATGAIVYFFDKRQGK